MLSHIHLGVDEFESAVRFYQPLMAELGLVVKFLDPAAGWTGWIQEGVPRPIFLIGKPYNRAPSQPGNGPMTAFIAKSRNVVDRCYAAAMAAGGACEGKPGLRPHYHADYYGAYFRDPDGNKLCVVCHEKA